MAKSNLTLEIESRFLDFLYLKKRELAITECTLGVWQQYGIVDVLSYQGVSKSNGRGKRRTRDVIWRCYEVKTSKTDFYSPAKWTFIGEYNYFVFPSGLYQQVKKDIPAHVGVYEASGNTFKSLKRATKMKPRLEHSEFMHEFLISVHRDARKWQKKGK